MDHVKSLKCLICGEEYHPAEIDYVCPKHGDEGIVDVQYDYDSSAGGSARQRWRRTATTRSGATNRCCRSTGQPGAAADRGWTPLYRTDRLAAGLGLKHVWVKDEGREPSASFKDRASAVAVVKGAERGAEVITTASTGNAGAALSAMCASVGKRT